MRTPRIIMFFAISWALSCTVQKKYELVLSIPNGKATNAQLDSSIIVLKKRLMPFDGNNAIITAALDQQSISLQTACADQDFIRNVLIKQGKLELLECLTLEDIEVLQALQNTDKAMSNAIQQGLPVITGVSNTVFQKEYPLLRLIIPQQPYSSPSGSVQYSANIATVADSDIPLLKKCLPLLYEQLPDCVAYFKKIEHIKTKVPASEIYLVKTNATVLDASHHIASAKADKSDDGRHPTVTMVFDNVGTTLWARMTAKNVGKCIAIVVDDKLLSTPKVLSAIEGGSTQIAGGFTMDEAKHIAATLNNGYLPLTLQIASINAISKQ